LVSKDGYEWVNPIEDEPMKKRRNTPPTDAAAEAILSPMTEAPIESPSATDIAEECATIARECAIAGAPKPANASVPPAREVPPQLPLEARKIEAEPQARREPPALPRVATLGAPISMPRTETAAPAPTVKIPAAAAGERRPRRFALLAACVALSAGLGALAGSLGTVEVARLLAPAPPAPAPRADASEEIRALKDSVAQLRTNLKAIGDNVAAVRTGLNASFSSSTGQLAKLAEAIEKLDRHQSDRHAAAVPSAPAAAAAQPAASPETTGSIGAAAGSKSAGPAVVDGWVLRKAYRGAALVEGRYGIIEIEPGDHLPGVGRVEEIKRQDGRWVVVTARGLIVGVQ
jgi:hypothetical protein